MVCGIKEENSATLLGGDGLILGIDKIAWPYILSGLWCAFFSFGFLALGKNCDMMLVHLTT